MSKLEYIFAPEFITLILIRLNYSKLSRMRNEKSTGFLNPTQHTRIEIQNIKIKTKPKANAKTLRINNKTPTKLVGFGRPLLLPCIGTDAVRSFSRSHQDQNPTSSLNFFAPISLREDRNGSS